MITCSYVFLCKPTLPNEQQFLHSLVTLNPVLPIKDIVKRSRISRARQIIVDNVSAFLTGLFYKSVSFKTAYCNHKEINSSVYTQDLRATWYENITKSYFSLSCSVLLCRSAQSSETDTAKLEHQLLIPCTENIFPRPSTKTPLICPLILAYRIHAMAQY